VYMRQASGHEVRGKETWVYLLVKALYGTKQAARAWQQHLKGLLELAKCAPMPSDPATYVRRTAKSFLIVGTHVDDLFVLFNRAGTELKDQLWSLLNQHLTIKDLGQATWTLQMGIKRDTTAGVLTLSQEAFTREVLRRFDMSNCKPQPTPAVDTGKEAEMDDTDLPVTDADKKQCEAMPVMELVGCLWWLAQMTRPDIFIALQQASKWTTKPSAKLWRWLVRILKYLAGTAHIGLTFRRDATGPPLLAYYDASFADEHQRKSTAGWVIYFHGSLIGYDAVTIKRGVFSSTEAECNAMTKLGKENVWQRRLYKQLMGVDELPPTEVYGDNAASILLLDSGVTKRTRYFDIEWFGVKDMIDAQEMKVQWIAGEDNLADFFTKKLPRERFVRLRNMIMGCAEEPIVVRCVDDMRCPCLGHKRDKVDWIRGRVELRRVNRIRHTHGRPNNAN